MVSEIYENADMVLGMNHFVELQDDIDTRELKINFLNGKVPTFPTSEMIIRLREC